MIQYAIKLKKKKELLIILQKHLQFNSTYNNIITSMIYNDVPLVTSKLLDENGGRARADIAFPLTSILVVKLTQELAGSAAGLLTQL